MSKTETVGVKISYGKRGPIVFHLRLIGLAEESEFRQKLFGLDDKDRAEKSYQANVDFLADLADDGGKMPDGLFPNKPKKVEDEVKGQVYIEHIPSVGAAVRTFFETKDAALERIAEYAVRGYFLAITPDVSFL